MGSHGSHRAPRRAGRTALALAAAAVLVAAGFVGTKAVLDRGSSPTATPPGPASPSRSSPASPAETGTPPSTGAPSTPPATTSPPVATSPGGTPRPDVDGLRPPIVQEPIPFPPERVREMAAYSERHYGISSADLTHPEVIVEHFTGGTSFTSAWNTFASNDPHLDELPGTCAHFIIDTDGTIYQLVPLSRMCRHTVGLNYTAFGIEDVGQSDQEVLDDPAQLRSMLRLTLWLMARSHISVGNVIGHNESLTSPFHLERFAPWRCQTHQDWNREDMDVFRARLADMAREAGVPVGPPARRVTPDC